MYLSITTTAKLISVDFGVYTPKFGAKQVFKKDDLRHVKLENDLIFVYFEHQTSAFQITIEGGSPYGLIVSDVNGVVPTTLSNLLEVMIAIMNE